MSKFNVCIDCGTECNGEGCPKCGGIRTMVTRAAYNDIATLPSRQGVEPRDCCAGLSQEGPDLEQLVVMENYDDDKAHAETPVDVLARVSSDLSRAFSELQSLPRDHNGYAYKCARVMALVYLANAMQYLDWAASDKQLTVPSEEMDYAAKQQENLYT